MCCVSVPQSAVGHEYQSKLSKHCSQTDTSKGFGGKFGVEADRVDQVKRQIFSDVLRSDSPLHSFTRVCFLQSAVGFEYAGKTEKHASQKGLSFNSIRRETFIKIL